MNEFDKNVLYVAGALGVLSLAAIIWDNSRTRASNERIARAYENAAYAGERAAQINENTARTAIAENEKQRKWGWLPWTTNGAVSVLRNYLWPPSA